MKIGINALGNVMNDTGGKTYLEGLVKGFLELGADDEIVLFAHRDCAGLFGKTPPNIRLRTTGSGLRSATRLLLEQVALPRWAQEEKLDAFYSPNNSLPLGLRCPAVMSIQNVLPFFENADEGWLRHNYRRWVMPRSIAKAKKVVVPSRFARDIVEKNFPSASGRTVVIPYGIDTGVFRPGPPPAGEPERPPFILWASMLWNYKNWEMTLAAFARLKKQFRHPHQLHMAGSPADRAVEKRFHRLLKTLGIEKDVIMLGQIAQRELAEKYRAAALFVYPSRIESFGFPVLEAMASGCPVVASACPALIELSGGGALHVELLNPDSLAEAMHAVLNEPQRRRSMVQRSLERASAFLWKKTAAQTLDAIRSVSYNQRVLNP